MWERDQLYFTAALSRGNCPPVPIQTETGAGPRFQALNLFMTPTAVRWLSLQVSNIFPQTKFQYSTPFGGGRATAMVLSLFIVRTYGYRVALGFITFVEFGQLFRSYREDTQSRERAHV